MSPVHDAKQCLLPSLPRGFLSAALATSLALLALLSPLLAPEAAWAQTRDGGEDGSLTTEEPSDPTDPTDPTRDNPDDLVAATLPDCQDPEVDPPQNFASLEEEEEPETIDLLTTTRTSGELAVREEDEIDSLLGLSDPAAYTTCQQQALDLLIQNGTIEGSMPDVQFPELDCEGRCLESYKAWARGHHHVWRARQVIHLIASKGTHGERSYLWQQRGLGSDGLEMTASTSPQFWFGPYSDALLATVKSAYDRLWSLFLNHMNGGIRIRLKCPDVHTEIANICFTAEPRAHHSVKGYVNLCPRFFNEETHHDFEGDSGDRCDYDCYRGRLMAHELMHHLWIKQNGVWVAVGDTHIMGHDFLCLQDMHGLGEAHYHEDAIRHMVLYESGSGDNCGHRTRNARNNDTYAWFAAAIGERIYQGDLAAWPMPADPTPQPPQNCDVGTEGCTCEGQETFPAGDPFPPDGDHSHDTWCPDNDGEATCVDTEFGAGTFEGICTKCEVTRGPGCECDWARPCDVGSCFGDDTFDGGVGQCWTDSPPKWACLVDCERLYNDPLAYCFYDTVEPQERARCQDMFCEPWDAVECAAQGKVCREGACVDECIDDQDCADLGYPGTFVCSAEQICEYAFD